VPLLDGSIVPFCSNNCIARIRANFVWKMVTCASKCVRKFEGAQSGHGGDSQPANEFLRAEKLCLSGGSQKLNSGRFGPGGQTVRCSNSVLSRIFGGLGGANSLNGERSAHVFELFDLQKVCPYV
jgi:hypothetical protein